MVSEMADHVDITLWIDRRWKDAIEKHLKDETLQEHLEDVLDELIDRYGSPPKSVQGLVDVSLVRVTAARVGIAEIVQRGDQLILYSDIVGPKQLDKVMEQYPHRVLYNAIGRPYFSLRVQKGESPLVLLRDVVTLLPGA
jgi:transcription-repair coupling factor (superfamily II helicase)